MFVHNTAVLLKTPAETVKSLSADVKKQTGIHFRRVNRFILLAVCGAHHCAGGQHLDPETGIWLTTENGTVGDTEKGLGQLFVQHIFPKPYNFINTMSNTATFYIAQSLKLSSPNITMACKDFAFERGLSLARVDIRRGAASGALVGGVDEAVFSEANLQSRFGDHLKDGSAWLYLTDSENGAKGEIRQVRSFAGQKDATAWIDSRASIDRPVVTFGVRIAPEEQRLWLQQLNNAEHFDHIKIYGYFDSAPAAGICLCFQKFPNRTCFHINKDIYDHYMIVETMVY